jgi:hypothetical protein
MPVEIHLAIIQSALEDPLEIELPNSPEETCLNRFTRPAKTFRRVCQQWKALIDQPSTYTSRLTTAVLTSDFYYSEDGPTPTAWEIYRSPLQLSKSLLAVKLVCYPPGTVPAKEICRLFPYRDRLVKFEAYLQDAYSTTHLIPLLGSLQQLPRLFDLTISDGDDAGANYSKIPPTDTFKEILQSLSSLRKLEIYSYELEDAIYIPSDLTSLNLQPSS